MTEWEVREAWDAYTEGQRAGVVSNILNQHLSRDMWARSTRPWAELEEELQELVAGYMRRGERSR